ncbi:MAG: hypothetical protein WCG25_01945 [bacterium]
MTAHTTLFSHISIFHILLISQGTIISQSRKIILSTSVGSKSHIFNL